jgi:hypothetical protein
MKRSCALGAAVVGALLVLGSPRALALPNDLQIFQLCSAQPCANSQNTTLSAVDPSAQARFRMLGDELGMALAGTTLEPANTVGINGFDFGFETAIVFINSSTQIANQSYWVTTNTPPAALVIPALHFRKGLPYSFEVDGRVSTVGDSSMFAGSVGLKWGILEGFRYAPDLSARFFMTRLFGQNDFDSTSGTLDFTIGKEIGLFGMFTISPYLGYALTGIDSSPRVFWGSANTTESEYQASPISQQQLFDEEKWNENMYDRFYGGLALTVYLVSFNIEYDYSEPSAFSSSSNPFPIRPGISTLGLRIALTL